MRRRQSVNIPARTERENGPLYHLQNVDFVVIIICFSVVVNEKSVFCCIIVSFVSCVGIGGVLQ